MAGSAKRLDWVDMAKGLSILLVVMMYSAFSTGEDTGGVGVLHWIVGFATPFRMPEFFLISGLFLSMVIARPWSTYADRRVVHYLYFYALWAVIHILFKDALIGRDPVGALGGLAWAIVEPYGVLWFIAMLAVFSAVTKLLFELRAAHWAVLATAAILQLSSVHTGSYLIDQFAAYFVYFYAGYALAPQIFRLADWANRHVRLAMAGLVVWSLINGALVFSPGFAVEPGHVTMGLAAIPLLHLALAITGTLALCVLAVLLNRLDVMAWLRWLGAKSLIIYLAFVLPMGIFRTLLLKVGVITDVSTISILTMVVAIVAPLMLYGLVQATGFGRLLFERPAWAHLRGRAGTNPARSNPIGTPAE